MNKVFLLIVTVVLTTSCAWHKTEPKEEPVAETVKITAEEERALEVAKAEEYVNLAVTNYQQGIDSLAIRNWKKALEIIPEDAEVHNFLGMALHRDGQIKKALHEFEAALNINPSYYEAYNNVGYIWFLLNNYDRAKAAYEQALSFKPDYEPALKNKKLLDKVIANKLAKMVFELDESAARKINYEEQIIDYKMVLMLDSTYAKAHNNIAVAYYYTGELDNALEHMKKAIHFRKDYPEAINNLGYLYKVAENYDMAIKFFLKALTLKPRYVGALNNLAETYFLNQEFQNAHRTLNTVLDLEPSNAVAKRWLIKVETAEAESGR